MIRKPLLTRPEGFPWGYTKLTGLSGVYSEIGIEFGILKIRKGEGFSKRVKIESLFLLLKGKLVFSLKGEEFPAERFSLFTDRPYALHCAPGETIRIRAEEDSELAFCGAENSNKLSSRFYGPEDIYKTEHRNKDIIEGTSYRIVRTIFDQKTRPESSLVLGECLTPQGRWSGFPPHHHPQPEIYHYRFTHPQGFGHVELGEKVFKLRNNDTLIIEPGFDHPHAAAPGYGMYALWIIRNLPDNPYSIPDTLEEHEWTTKPGSSFWYPEE